MRLSLSRLLVRLTPHELRQAEGMVAEARERTEAVMEIQARERAEAVMETDARADVGGPAASCPRCGGGERVC